ncbi:MAG: ABC transporter permease [Chloroflexi bacterium]|nr:ABC transporter permease [Chloroflexota bacterium]
MSEADLNSQVATLLSDAESAVRRREWKVARDLCDRLLRLDPTNETARAIRSSLINAQSPDYFVTQKRRTNLQRVWLLLLNRITKRFALMILIIWAASTVMFVVPRQFGINPSQAGWFSSSPQKQRLNDLVKELQAQRDSLVGTYDEADLPQEIRDARDAINAQLSERNSRTAFERQFGFGDPMIIQYRRYIFALAKFDLGASRRFFPVPVFTVVRESVFWTIGLVGVATLLAFTIGSLAGALMGWPNARRSIRWGFTPLLAVSAIPYYLLGWILIWFMAFKWGWFPLSGGWNAYDPNLRPNLSITFILDALHHAVLPGLAIIISTVGLWTVTMRGLMINMQGEDYMVFAAAKGLKQRRLFFRYGIRNAMLPQVTGLAASVGTILSGVLLVEIVFAYPGIGFLFWRSIRTSDVTMMTGVAFVVIVMLAVAMFLLDLLLPVLDRRIKDQPD